MPQGKGTYGSKRGRPPIIKAHKGFAHVPRTEGQRPPTKGRGRPPTGRRMIGLPQRFRGGGRRPSTQKQNLPAWARKQALEEKMLPQESMAKAKPEKTTPLSKAQLKALQMAKDQYRRITAPVKLEDIKKQYEADIKKDPQRGMIPQLPSKVQPVYEKPNRGRRFLIRPDVAPPPSESVRAPAPQTLRPILPQIRYKGGYVSRAKYGQVNNLKKKK